MDPMMEMKLYEWYKNKTSQGERLTSSIFKSKAIELSSVPEFLASKGWLDKFKKRYKIKLYKDTNTHHYSNSKAMSRLKNKQKSVPNTKMAPNKLKYLLSP